MKIAPIITPLVLANAQLGAALTFPPTAGGNVAALPDGWQGLPASQGDNAFAYQLAQGGGGCIPQIDIDLTADGAETLTAVEIYAAIRETLTVTGGATTFSSVTSKATKTAHGYKLGDGPIQYTGGTLPAALDEGTDYWPIPVDANTYYIADSFADALAGNHITLADNGSGTIDDEGGTNPTTLKWLSLGKAPGDDGTAGDVTLSATLGKTFTVYNRPRFVAIAVSATVGSGTAHVSIDAYPVKQLAS